MRYIGNKTRLLPFLLGAVRRLGIAPGVAHDAFAGTASVGRALKTAGWRVASSDLMDYSYVLQRAYVVAQRVPSFADVRVGDPDFRSALRSGALQHATRSHNGSASALGEAARFLTLALPPSRGFIAEHFAPRGGRMYFTDQNAERIDAIRERLHHWRAEGLVSDDGFYILLAALIEGADRIANTAGVYAAYMKRWQPNARRPLQLAPMPPLRGARGCTAHRADASVVAREIGAIDLLYVDPPYNSRQYAGYYHVPEIIARGWMHERPHLSGRTGMLSDRAVRSAWCSPLRVRDALVELLESTRARHLLVSYNTEGLLSARTLSSVLREASADGVVRRFRRRYRRYRADRDRVGRRYRGDHVSELLYYTRLR
ncbi:MAG TPA: DNA adenine methylase [Gemmatimonadaceae bacterium]|nr:DNA adenine methylase [Gemmatimonadaceae bacterium]